MRRELSKKKFRPAQQGFTLLEVILAVSLFGIIVVVGSTSFLNILKTATKTRTTNLVKQNGDYAIGVMERMIRNARGMVGIPAGTEGYYSEITIKNPNSGETTFSCLDFNSDGTNEIASVSADTKTTGSLIGKEVEVVDCINVFWVKRDLYGISPDVVTINFRLIPSIGARPGARPEEQSPMDFQTTVTMRNLPEE